jgi:Uma2 family endonuclease
MAFQPKQPYTLEEYSEPEKKSDERLEFWGGTVWSMSGASRSHDRIITNLTIEIGSKIRAAGCDVFSPDMRVKVPTYSPYRYPDLTALCGKAEFERAGRIDMLVNSQLIVEVLSDSTESFDRGDKFSYYKSIESFSEYLLIAQHRPHISQFVKHGDGFWINLEYNDLSETMELKSLLCGVPVSAIYQGVAFPEQDPKEARHP